MWSSQWTSYCVWIDDHCFNESIGQFVINIHRMEIAWCFGLIRISRVISLCTNVSLTRVYDSLKNQTISMCRVYKSSMVCSVFFILFCFVEFSCRVAFYTLSVAFRQLHKRRTRDDLSYQHQIQSDSIQLINNASCCLHACYVYSALW